jgi:hypothetical protein
MTRKALIEQNHETIKAHISDPENSPLPSQLQEQLDRIISMAKVLDKNPLIHKAVNIHLSKYREISKRTAYNDAKLAVRLFNTIHTFDYDFWQTWNINDIVQNITDCRKDNSPQNRRIIAMEHANLIKALGEKPEMETDPKRNEKHQFYILVQVNNKNVKFDINNLHKLPVNTLRELNQALSAGDEINESQALELMNS